MYAGACLNLASGDHNIVQAALVNWAALGSGLHDDHSLLNRVGGSHDALLERLSSAASSDQRSQEYHIWLSLAFFICAIVFSRTDIHAAV